MMIWHDTETTIHVLFVAMKIAHPEKRPHYVCEHTFDIIIIIMKIIGILYVQHTISSINILLLYSIYICKISIYYMYLYMISPFFA